MKVISRQEARKLGLKRYFTGIPCPKGHISEAYVSNHFCVACAKDSADKFKKENPNYVAYYNRQYQRKKQKELHYRLSNRLRCTINKAIRRKRAKRVGSAVKLLGCSIEYAIQHIESLWYRPDMTWETWGSGPGTWQIDHKRALLLFDLADQNQLAEACNISNLQPLWFDDHVRKTSEDMRK